jgi:hypothetical protein
MLRAEDNGTVSLVPLIVEDQERAGRLARWLNDTIPAPAASLIEDAALIAKTTWRIIAAPLHCLVLLSLFAFVSFIYEEGLQAAAFATRTAIDANDPAIARACLIRQAELMHAAQRYQSRAGWLAFWAHRSYWHYFHTAAPAQVAAYYTQGVDAGLWPDDIDRYKYYTNLRGQPVYDDTWTADDSIRFANARVDAGMPGPMALPDGSPARGSILARRHRSPAVLAEPNQKGSTQ